MRQTKDLKPLRKTGRYDSVYAIVRDLASLLTPAERLTVSQSASKYRYLNNQGSYVGFWNNTKAPYLIEPMDMLGSHDHRGVVFVGPAQSGKALAVDTPIALANGKWVSMDELKVGDIILDPNMWQCRVTFATETMYDHECRQIVFEDIYGQISRIVADIDHLWVVGGVDKPITTRELRQGMRIYRYGEEANEFTVRDNREHDSVPVRCIQVDSPSHMFLAGEQMVPTHNTEIILNWTLHSVKCDPMDMLIFCPTQTAGRDFSVRRVDRLNRHSKPVGDLLIKRKDADNKFDKHYMNGMMLTLSWPSVTELAGRPVPRVALTDYDRMPTDVDGDGSPYDLASKRTTTFGSFAMTLAESSPSQPITDVQWIAGTPHEAPPCEGILSLYNRGDRRRWYWPCPHCEQYFEGRFHMLEWDDIGSPLECAETVRMICPHCSAPISPDSRQEMQQWGMWVRDGEAIDSTGRRFGTAGRTSIASFWLNGVAASFTKWKILVEAYMNAEAEYQRTGSEESLKKFYNTDLGEPYIPKGVDTDRLPEHLKARAEVLGEKVVPEGVRFLVANVDVQKDSFVVQVHGICPGEPFDMVLVDRFRIAKSKRIPESRLEQFDVATLTDEQRQSLVSSVRPSSYLDDWDLITEQVIEAEYPLADGSGRMMRVKMTTCDMGGFSKNKGEGVSSMAYNYYRKLRKEGKHGRFVLTKGDGKPGAPRARITTPDSNRSDVNAIARGDVPVLQLNSNILKDALNARLECITPGKGMFRWPDWLPDWWYMEMCAETRTSKGWECPKHVRNEAWDLAYYCIGVCVSKMLNIELLDWSNPPGWAAEWDKNDMIRKVDQPKRFAGQEIEQYDFAELARKLA